MLSVIRTNFALDRYSDLCNLRKKETSGRKSEEDGEVRVKLKAM
jgi:hypothetical protein